jgi:hypothetical protein
MSGPSDLSSAGAANDRRRALALRFKDVESERIKAADFVGSVVRSC